MKSYNGKHDKTGLFGTVVHCNIQNVRIFIIYIHTGELSFSLKVENRRTNDNNVEKIDSKHTYMYCTSIYDKNLENMKTFLIREKK